VDGKKIKIKKNYFYFFPIRMDGYFFNFFPTSVQTEKI
jgi:hypothetical protein